MKISKEIRQLSRTLVRDSYVDGALNRDKINSIVRTIIEKKPRNYIQLLENYRRLLRLEVEKRRAAIESPAESSAEESTAIDPEAMPTAAFATARASPAAETFRATLRALGSAENSIIYGIPDSSPPRSAVGHRTYSPRSVVV